MLHAMELQHVIVAEVSEAYVAMIRLLACVSSVEIKHNLVTQIYQFVNQLTLNEL